MKLRGNSFFQALLKMNMLPLILLTLMITVFSAARFASSMNLEARNGLVNLCHTVVELYDAVYEGEYSLENSGDVVHMMKGDHRVDADFSIIDSIKEKTGVDITIFYQDVRMITTIRTNSGIRAVGTKASDVVVEDVLKKGQPHFYSSTIVEGVRYFSYYEPIYTSDGTCIGMIFLGKPSAEVEKLVLDSIMPAINFGLLMILIVCFVTTRFSKKLVSALQRMEIFVTAIAEGELHTELDADVLERKDELGQTGRCLIKMQRSLQELVELDILTGLYNRRSGEKLLKQACENYRKDGTPFCVAIGDIDHFKKVNDSYGHECGDIVLVRISELIKEHMQGRGFVARWGGEEMLLVYDNMRLEAAASCMRKLMEEIRALRIPVCDTQIGITMTFGIMEGNAGKLEHIVRDADAKLYEGKNSGRDIIVY